MSRALRAWLPWSNCELDYNRLFHECPKQMPGTPEENATHLPLPPLGISADAHAASSVGGPAVLIDLLAHAIRFSVSLGFGLLLAGIVCAGLMTTASQFSRTARSSRQAIQASSLRSLVDRLQAVAKDPETQKQRDQFVRDIDSASRQLNLATLGSLSRQLHDLLDRYNESYEVHVVSDAEELRGFTREEPGETGFPVRACYIIVEARDSSGRAVSQPVRTATIAGNVPAVRWAERVPDEIYDRIISARPDDQHDNQSLFAIKERGRQTLVMRMAGLDGQPLNRQAQLTEW